MSEDVLILFSGGADSRMLLELALGNGFKPLCVLINYGQGHIEELEFAKEQLQKKEIEWIEITVPINVESALTGDHVGGQYEGVHSHHVPGRNLIFISQAASIAEALKIDTIWYGPDWSDYLNKFPDCYQEWVGRVNSVLEINGSRKLKLEAPLLGMSKELILTTLEIQYDVNIEKELYSGYGDLS